MSSNKTLIVDDLLISYSQAGGAKKPVILLLHGWGDNKETFKNLEKLVDKKYQQVTVDMPGFGASQAPEEVWGISDYAKFVGKFIEKAKIKVKVVIGHSNGGAIAIYGLAHNHFESEKLVLLASAGIRDVDQVKKKVLKALAKSAKAATKALPKKAQGKVKKKAYEKIGSELHLVPGMEETFKKTVSHDISDDALKLKLPTLLIYGENDTSTPHHYGEKLNNLIPYSKLITLPGFGHMLHHEEPKQISEIINEFLK